MEEITIHWKPRAISHLKKQAKWYAENLGMTAANKFWNGIIATGDLLSKNPYLGIIEKNIKSSIRLKRIKKL